MVSTLAIMIALAAISQNVAGRSRTTVVVGSQPVFSAETGTLRLQQFAPVVEELSIAADPGIEGLRIVADGWAMVDAGDRFYADRARADLLEAHLEWKSKNLGLKAGRLFLFSDAGRGKRIDGGAVSVRAGVFDGLHFDAESWVGSPVSSEPRIGDFAFGVRTAAGWSNLFEVGAGYVHERDVDEIDREAVIGRVHVAPIPELALDAFGSFDIYAGAVEDAELALSVRPVAQLRGAIYGRTKIPGLTLPSTSIFSVFAGEEHAEVGVEADWFVARLMRLTASAEIRRTSYEEESSVGYRLTAGMRSGLSFWPEAKTALTYERLSDGWVGRYDYLRGSAEFPMSEIFTISPDAGIFFVERADRLAGRLGLAAAVRPVRDVSIAVAGRAVRAADGAGELAVIGRIEWNVDYTF